MIFEERDRTPRYAAYGLGENEGGGVVAMRFLFGGDRDRVDPPQSA